MKTLLSLLFFAVFMSASTMAQEYALTDVVAEVSIETTETYISKSHKNETPKKLKKQSAVKKNTKKESSSKLANHRAVIDKNTRVASRY